MSSSVEENQESTAPVQADLIRAETPSCDPDSALESAFLPDAPEDAVSSPHLDEYHDLITYFYERAIEYGWRTRPPPALMVLRQTKILLDYERQGYKPWAIRTMVEWQVEHHRSRDRPIVSFDFFDASNVELVPVDGGYMGQTQNGDLLGDKEGRSFPAAWMVRDRYPTPMQEALEATWHERHREYRASPKASEVDPEGLKRLREMYDRVFSVPARSETEERNAEFQKQIRRRRTHQQSRQAILERLDPPDRTVPTVDDLKAPGYQEAAG